MPTDAVAEHGLTGEFLADMPPFADIADEFLHSSVMRRWWRNRLLNADLKRVANSPSAIERVVDTLALARRKHPRGHNTLDDLSARYCVDRSPAANTARCSMPSCWPRYMSR